MVADVEGFLHPRIDTEKCVNCGLCEARCPVLIDFPSRKPLAVYAAQSKDAGVRLESSSGGVFSLMAENVLKEGGVVFGASFDEEDWSVRHVAVERTSDLWKLRGSKYVQSSIGNVFRDARSWLSKGRKVLFSGTPCQIAGILSFLGPDKINENLFLADVVCHAVPSPNAWSKYLDWRVLRLGENIHGIAFRNKLTGWKNYSVRITSNTHNEYSVPFTNDSFMQGFINDLFNRPSCHACHFKQLRSGSDVTIADYWGVGGQFHDMDDDMGTSLVMVNTGKGEVMINQVLDRMFVRVSDFEYACKTNISICRSTKANINRTSFFAKLGRSVDFDRLVWRMLLPPFRFRVRRLCGAILRKMGVRI